MSQASQRGSVSVVCAAAICIALVCTMGVADVGRVLVERSHAEAAADAVVTVRRAFTGLLLVPGSFALQARARAVIDLP